MKVIRTDNYDREIYADVLVASNMSETVATVLARKLNENAEEQYYYEAVADDYRLFEGFEPL